MQALRHAEREALQERRYSPKTSPRPSGEHPRGSFPDEPDFYDDQEEADDRPHGARPGPLGGGAEHDAGIGDGELGDQGDDDSLDDDLLDKISSSPSIDDGKYALSVVWPPRRDSMVSGVTHSPLPKSIRGRPKYFPHLICPNLLPLSVTQEADNSPESHRGGYVAEQTSAERRFYPGETLERSPFPRHQPTTDDEFPSGNNKNSLEFEADDLCRFLLPVNDPLLDNNPGSYDGRIRDDGGFPWEDEDGSALAKIESSSDDDTGNFQFTDNPRFIDSGWGGECLRETEDIDFEFVYALHTFVATVEGQANAAKGDTMVLLDDTNSYWWLVRVVKDGSIGV